MRAFRFSLQRVLDVKLLLEEQQKQALAAARVETAAVEGRLDEARRERALAVRQDGAAVARADGASRGHRPEFDSVPIDPWLRELGWRRREMLFQRVQLLTVELSERRRREEEARAKLVERLRDRRVLERLADKQRQEHFRDEARREQAVLDEAAMQRRRWPLVGDVGE